MADNKNAPSSRLVAGVWQRVWEEDPLGDTNGIDEDTLVLWTQTPDSGLYVDLRLPINSPGRSLENAQKMGYKPCPSAIQARGFVFDDDANVSISSSSSSSSTSSIFTSDIIDILLRQKSFAGVLHYSIGDTTTSRGEALSKDSILAELATEANKLEKEDGVLPLCTCFWRRDIDYQPPSGGLDIGVCASSSGLVNMKDGSVDIRETGDDGSYAELWRRLPDTFRGPFMALTLESENNHPRNGIWVRAGSKFAYAIGRPTDPLITTALHCSEKSEGVKDCIGKSLSDAIKSSLSIDQLLAQLQVIGSYVAVAGEIITKQGDDTITKDNCIWRILHSTNPQLVGCSLIDELNDDSLCCSTLQLVVSGEATAASAIEPGCFLDQYIKGKSDVTRRWKVVEIEGNNKLPGCSQ